MTKKSSDKGKVTRLDDRRAKSPKNETQLAEEGHEGALLSVDELHHFAEKIATFEMAIEKPEGGGQVSVASLESLDAKKKGGVRKKAGQSETQMGEVEEFSAIARKSSKKQGKKAGGKDE